MGSKTKSQLPTLPSPFLALFLFLLVFPFLNNLGNIRWHSWIFRVKSWTSEMTMRQGEVIVSSSIGSHSPHFSLNTASDREGFLPVGTKVNEPFYLRKRVKLKATVCRERIPDNHYLAQCALWLKREGCWGEFATGSV
jgi:hypothetical protein